MVFNMFGSLSVELVFLLYCTAAAALVFFSIQCANYVDLIDKKTNISGAFIGGVVLAAVTSLPEFVTSISAIYAVNNPGLIIGNVLGSNVFNLCIFGVLTAFAVRAFRKAPVGKAHRATILCTLAAYALTAATIYLGEQGKTLLRIPGIEVNLASLLILGVYVISFRFLSNDDSENEEEDTSPLTVRQVVIRFIAMACGLVAMSVFVTMLTDEMQKRIDWLQDASLAGALLLGVVTSLPELTSSIALVRLKNFNAMVGNVVGSNMFNFTIFSVADILAGNTVIYVGGGQTGSMLLFGTVSSVLVLLSLFFQGRAHKHTLRKTSSHIVLFLLGILVLASYLMSLVIPV